MKTWLITGCSTGLGRALAFEILNAGFNAIVTARDFKAVQEFAEKFPERALPLSLDVTDKAAIAEVVRAAEKRFGTIDVLVNNAGYGYRGAVEEGNDEEVSALFGTNFFGTVNMIKAVLPGMRERRSGAILNVSSIAGRLAAPGSGYYSATKFAVEGMSDALRKELAPLGIRVVVVEPGAFRTDFAGRSLHQASANIADYAETAGPRRKENDKTHGAQPGDPVRAAKALIEIVNGDNAPFRALLGTDAIKIVGDELDKQRAELDAWKELSKSTDYPAGH